MYIYTFVYNVYQLLFLNAYTVLCNAFVGLNSIQFNLMVRLPMYSAGGFALHACTLTPGRWWRHRHVPCSRSGAAHSGWCATCAWERHDGAGRFGVGRFFSQPACHWDCHIVFFVWKVSNSIGVYPGLCETSFFAGTNYSELSRGHPTWWFCTGPPPKFP